MNWAARVEEPNGFDNDGAPAWPRLYQVHMECGCEVETWRVEPYPGDLRCGFREHETGSAEWAELPSVLIPTDLAESSAEAMHLLRLFAVEEWGFDEAAQVSVMGPHAFELSPTMGWWERRPAAIDGTEWFWIGRVAPS